ncbi:MAG: RHS repeat-associated core domain-containing protein [Planctomycetota bacterium]
MAEVTVQVAAGDVDVTSYTYEWHHDGTLDENPTHQMKKRTTTHEVAVTGENGSGVAEVTEEYWDTAGRLTFMKDAAGYVDYYEYDGDTGTVTKMVVDADPSVYTTITNKPTRGGGLPTALELTTTYDVDDLGRVIKMTDPEGNETHTIYYDEQHATATFSGWTGTSTTGPITIQREVRGGTVFTETMTLDADPDVVAAAPDPDQTLANLIASGTIESLTRSITNNSGQVVEVDRYHDLSGITYSDTSVYLGTASNDSSTGNYHATFGTYDDRGRSERSTDATGTITWNVYDGLGRVTAVYAGTDATGWSHGDPVGTDPANNMALIAEYEYDHGEVGDGNLTKMIEYPGGSAAARVTLNHYDWRNRLVATHSGLTVSGGVTAVDASTDSLVSYSVYDNLGRVIEQRGYAGGAYSLTPSETDGVPDAPADGALRSMSRTHFDDRGRVYRTEVFDVDPVNGDDPDTITGSLASDTWYDARGNVIKTRQPGGLVSKTLYDGAGRPTVMFTSDGGGDSLYVDADDVVGDNVLEQVEYVYDDNGNVIATVARQRHHDETATGDLTTTGTDSRDTYAASYYDDADRLTASVNVGTNGGSSWTRPTSAPARSDTVLVTDYTYDDAGRLQDVTDPRGLLTRTDYDLLGRTIATTENYVDGTPGDDNDRITRYTYDGVGNVLTLTADLPAGQADQTTKYEYAATIAGGSTVESNNILTSIWYPDPDDGLPDNSAQKETFSNNRLGQRTAWTDRNGTTHEYEYDVLGRLGSDEITTFGTTGSGTGVDDTVDRLTYAFDDAGRPLTFTSRDTTLGSTDNLNIVNRVRRVYNGFGQLTREYQSLDGNDDTDDNGEADSGVPFVEYSYDASGNFSRMESMTYPGGREVFYQYASGLDADVSRLTQLTDDAAGTALLESFTYLGLGTVVERGRGNGIDLTHIGTVTAGDDGGDQYVGFDRFGRIENMLWTDGTTTSDSFAYGYDRNGNRLYEENLLTTGHDELYHDGGGGGGYDGLNRLTSFARGDLNGTFDAITGTAARTQAWDLDALGNMPTVTTDGVAESRTTDSQNRLTDVGSETLAHSANGEMTEDEEGRELVYDAWGRLTEWVLQPGARGGAPIESVSYAYDTLNRRIARTPLGYTRSDAVLAGGELYFHSVQWQVIEERDDTDDLLATNVWSPVYVDAMIARDENAQGVLDTAFDGDGQVTTDLGGDDSAESVAIQSDGKIVVGGTSDGDFALARYNTDGTLDTTFGTSGTTVVDIGNTDTLGDIAILSSGKILAVGGTDDGTDTDIALAVFNSDGSLYTSWASGGIRVSDYGGDEFATSVAVQSDGKIVVAGTMNDDWVGARYNTNGTLDTTFSSNGWASFDPSGGGVDIVQTVAIDGSGKIVVGGSIGSTSDSFAIGRLTSAGAWDTSFSGNGWVTTSFVGAFLGGAMSYDLALQSDGKIVAVGYSPVQGGPASLLQMTVVRYTTAGGLDTTFGEAGKLAITGYSRFSSDSVATSVKLQSDGKIVVGGFTGDSTSSDNFALARLETDGTLDRSFGPGSGGGLVTADFGGEDQAWDIALLSDGRVVTVGHTDVGTDSDFALTVHHAEDPATRRLYAQHDANFNVTAIADAAGSVVERYLYDAYGLRTVLDADWTADLDGATDYAWYHSHQGGRLDPLTGLHHFRHRDYDATLMRWTRQDPLGFVDGASLYLAYLASPPNTTDAHGLEGNERRKRPSRPTREEKLEQWRKSMKREMLSALGSMCPDEDDEESCCSRDECLKQAKQLTDAVVDTLHIHRSNRRWDQNGGVLGNLANAAPQIANTVLGAFTGDYEAVPRGNMECFDWQMLIMNAVNPIQSSRPADENCFSVVTNQSGAVFQHNWVEVKTGGKTVILDPWGSGGRDIVVDKPGDRPQTSGSGSGRRRR